MHGLPPWDHQRQHRRHHHRVACYQACYWRCHWEHLHLGWKRGVIQLHLCLWRWLSYEGYEYIIDEHTKNWIQQRCALQHSTRSKISTGSSKFVEALVYKEHLTERFKTIWSSPWLLHSFDMLWFRYGGAKAVGSSECANEFKIVSERVLSR